MVFYNERTDVIRRKRVQLYANTKSFFQNVFFSLTSNSDEPSAVTVTVNARTSVNSYSRKKRETTETAVMQPSGISISVAGPSNITLLKGRSMCDSPVNILLNFY